MLLVSVTIFILLALLRATLIEIRYCQSIKAHEPAVWQALQPSRPLTLLWRFVQLENSTLFKQISHSGVLDLAVKTRRAQIQFVVVFVFALIAAVVFFRLA
ncbi:MAG: hypothetical protein ACI9FJ_000395 [Alteromonadaceae bacterium]|jgi:hypothetical protein